MASRKALSSLVAQATRSFSAAAGGAHPPRKVAVLGAAGGIGQPLGLLMKVREGRRERGIREKRRGGGVAGVRGGARAPSPPTPFDRGRRPGHRLPRAPTLAPTPPTPHFPPPPPDQPLRLRAGPVRHCGHSRRGGRPVPHQHQGDGQGEGKGKRGGRGRGYIHPHTAATWGGGALPFPPRPSWGRKGALPVTHTHKGRWSPEARPPRTHHQNGRHVPPPLSPSPLLLRATPAPTSCTPPWPAPTSSSFPRACPASPA
jgi:hypothetical protein